MNNNMSLSLIRFNDSFIGLELFAISFNIPLNQMNHQKYYVYVVDLDKSIYHKEKILKTLTLIQRLENFVSGVGQTS